MDCLLSDIIPLRANIQLGKEWYCVNITGSLFFFGMLFEIWLLRSVWKSANHITRQTRPNVPSASMRNARIARGRYLNWRSWRGCGFVYDIAFHVIHPFGYAPLTQEGFLKLEVQCNCGGGPNVVTSMPVCIRCRHEMCASCNMVM